MLDLLLEVEGHWNLLNNLYQEPLKLELIPYSYSAENRICALNNRYQSHYFVIIIGQRKRFLLLIDLICRRMPTLRLFDNSRPDFPLIDFSGFSDSKLA